MMGIESLAAALLAGVVTSMSPCALAAVPVAVGYVGGAANEPRRAWALSIAFIAGMNAALLAMGLLAARLGMLLGSLPGPWSISVGILVVGAAAWMWRADAAACAVRLPPVIERQFRRSGIWGAAVLGGLIGTVMTPCATPALAAALALAGSGAMLEESMWWGAALLLAYGLGHSVLLLVAGAVPTLAATAMRRFAGMQAWLPGQRTFSLVLGAAGVWWIARSLQLIDS